MGLAGHSFPPPAAARQPHRATPQGPPDPAALPTLRAAGVEGRGGGRRPGVPAGTAAPTPGRRQERPGRGSEMRKGRRGAACLPAPPRPHPGRALAGLPGPGTARGSPGGGPTPPSWAENGPRRYRTGGRGEGRSAMKQLGLVGLLGAALLGVSGAGAGAGALPPILPSFLPFSLPPFLPHSLPSARVPARSRRAFREGARSGRSGPSPAPGGRPTAVSVSVSGPAAEEAPAALPPGAARAVPSPPGPVSPGTHLSPAGARERGRGRGEEERAAGRQGSARGPPCPPWLSLFSRGAGLAGVRSPALRQGGDGARAPAGRDGLRGAPGLRGHGRGPPSPGGCRERPARAPFTSLSAQRRTGVTAGPVP